MTRARAYGTTLLFLALVMWPLFRDPPRDSFPLSDFPMFSHGRSSPRFTLVQALGVTSEGARRPLPPMVATGNREVLQAMVWLGAAVRDPPRSCREITARVAASPAHHDVRAVELVTSDFDAVAYFEGPRAPVGRVVHVRCGVGP